MQTFRPYDPHKKTKIVPPVKPNFGLPKKAPGLGTSILNTIPTWNTFQGPAGSQPSGSDPYSGQISDYLNQMRADAGASGVADKASLIGSLRRYMISYGAMPDFSALGISPDALGYLKEAMDPNTLKLAQDAEAQGLSIHARLGHENDIANRRIPSSLAARGMLHSGQTGSDLAEQALTFKQKGYDTLNEMLNSIEGNVGSFQSAERDRQRALADAEMQAGWGAADNSGDSYMGDTPAAPSVPLAAAKAAAARKKATRAQQLKKASTYGRRGN